jgi:hypothetical protein
MWSTRYLCPPTAQNNVPAATVEINPDFKCRHYRLLPEKYAVLKWNVAKTYILPLR